MLSRLRSLLLRLAGSPEPRPAAGVISVAQIGILGTAGYTAVAYYVLTHPEIAPFIDGEVLETAFTVNTRIALPTLVGFLVAGRLAKERWPDKQFLPYGLLIFTLSLVAFYSYLAGHYTDPYGAAFLFSVVALGSIFFEARIVRAGLISFCGIVFATTVAEQIGIIPYAPLYIRPPFEGGHLASFSVMAGGFPVLFAMAVAFFFLAVMELGRDREQKLRRATGLIRRYVPAQLAEKILAGEHTEETHPVRRKVTLFFSDVVGFTQAADQMEPEDLSALLDEYLSEMARIADSFGATVNQFVGDGIMIFFGAPEATTDHDHALRAVHMALAMQRRMGELREKWFNEGTQTPFRIRIGINTGVASVGDFGSKGRTTYSAIGNQTNLTARIQAHCEPGKVLISHTTWALVKDEIPCKERGEIEVKGLHYAVRAYEVAEEASPVAGA